MLETRLNEKNEIIKELIKVGIKETIAIALATKYYNNELTKADLEKLKLEFQNEINKLDSKIDSVESKINAKFELVDYKIDTLNETIDKNTVDLVKLIEKTKKDLVDLINDKLSWKHQLFTVLVAISSVVLLHILKNVFKITI